MPEWEQFTSPSYKLDTPHDGCSQMVNLFPETIERGPRAGKFRLRSIPGLRTFTSLGSGPIRALLGIDGGNRLFAISGENVYEVFRDGSSVMYTGDLVSNSHPAIMVSNGFQIAVASGGHAYLIEGQDGGGGLVNPVSFTDGTPLNAGTIDFLDNYFIASEVGTKRVYISNLAPDGAVWDSANVKVKEGYGDNVSRVFSDNEQLWVFGFETLEVWVNTGALFPFERIQGAVLRIGCSDPYSVAGAGGYRFWRSGSIVYGAYGINPERISDYGVEQALSEYGDTKDAEGWCYISGGHTFYVLSIPSAQRTWVFDLREKCWHERLYWERGQWSQYRGRVHAEAFGQHVVGDPTNGNLYFLDANYYKDAGGTSLRRLRVCPYLTIDQKNIRHNQLTIDVDTGNGLQVADGEVGYDPQLTMRYSDDRGKTWGNERQASLGKAGETKTRVIYNQNGASRIGKVYELSCTDPIPLSLVSAYIKLGQPEAGR